MVDRVPNPRIRELCGVVKWADESIDGIVLRWFGHIERVDNDRIGKRVYMREYVDIHLVDRPRKRRIDSVND